MNSLYIKNLSLYLVIAKDLDSKSGIYKINHIPTNRNYIGQSTDLGFRTNTHAIPSTWAKFPNSYLYRAIKKYGLDQFTLEVLQFISKPTKDILAAQEMFWMKQQNGTNVFNLINAADSVFQHSVASKALIAINNPNRVPIFVKDMATDQVWTFISMGAAAAEMNVSQRALGNCLKNGHLLFGVFKIGLLPKSD